MYTNMRTTVPCKNSLQQHTAELASYCCKEVRRDAYWCTAVLCLQTSSIDMIDANTRIIVGGRTFQYYVQQ